MGRLNASVIVAAYTEKRWDDLCGAVASVACQTTPPLDTIVVVDGNPALHARAQRAFPDATVVANAGPAGISGARNTGASVARGDVLVFLDDDAVAAPTWLEELLAGYEEPSVLGVGGRIVPKWAGARPSWFPSEFDWVVGCTYAGMREDAGPVRNPIGANMSMRRWVYDDAGGFDARLGRVERAGTAVNGTADETEFCIRQAVRHPGSTWLYRPSAVVEHAVTPQRATWRYFVRRCLVEGAAKARLVDLAGAGAGLASERRYVRIVLPRATLRELARGLRGHGAAVLRAGAIVAGVSLTASAYLRVRLAGLRVRRAARPTR